MGTQRKETEKWNEVGTDSVAPIRFRARWYLSQINLFQMYMYATIRSCFFFFFFLFFFFLLFFLFHKSAFHIVDTRATKKEGEHGNTARNEKGRTGRKKWSRWNAWNDAQITQAETKEMEERFPELRPRLQCNIN